MSLDTQWYFAYGSNMSTQQMLKRTGSVPESRVAHLDGYRIAFRKYRDTEEVYADILPDKTKKVIGVAYRCSDKALEQLDIFEGVAGNCYRRENISIELTDSDEKVTAVAYLGSLAFSETESNPSQEYLDRILAGLSDHKIDSVYAEMVQRLAGRSRL
jgi:gamma-glutamylcyclotransferase